jgi:hypothetical protein
MVHYATGPQMQNKNSKQTTTEIWVVGYFHFETASDPPAATALNYSGYNFIKIHRTLRMSPAMAADSGGRKELRNDKDD